MSFVSIPWKPSNRDLRAFAVLQFVFFLILVGYRSVRHSAGIATISLLLIPALIAMVGTKWPQRIRLIYLVWMIAVFPIGWIVSHLILAIVYFGVVTPIGRFRRWTGHDPLGRQSNPTATTYWKERPQAPANSRYFDQF